MLWGHFAEKVKKNKKGEHLPQLLEDYPQIVPYTAQQGIDLVADAALQPVSA